MYALCSDKATHDDANTDISIIVFLSKQNICMYMYDKGNSRPIVM